MRSQYKTGLHVGAPYMIVRKRDDGRFIFEWKGPYEYEDVLCCFWTTWSKKEHAILVRLPGPFMCSHIPIDTILYDIYRAHGPIELMQMGPVAGGTVENLKRLLLDVETFGLDSYRHLLYTVELSDEIALWKRAKAPPPVVTTDPPQQKKQKLSLRATGREYCRKTARRAKTIMQSTLNHIVIGLHAIRSLKQKNSTNGSEEILEPQKVEHNMKTPIPTSLIITHTDAHADEAYGIYNARRYGEARLPGIKTAKVAFVLDGPFLSQAEYDAKGMATFGCGGSRYDEHRTTGRLPDSSCTKLVLEDLEVTDRAALILGKEIDWCDRNRRVSPTQLAALVKSFHRYMSGKTNDMLDWTSQAFDAIIYRLNLPFVTDEKVELGIVQYFDGLLKAGWFKGKEREVKKVRKLLERSAENTTRMNADRTYYTEADYIVRAMQRAGVDNKAVYAWVTNVALFLIQDQVLTTDAVGLIAQKRNRFTAPAKNHPTGNVRVCVLQTENQMALNTAMNIARQEVVVLRNKIGQVKIFLDLSTGLNLDLVMGMIRWMETPVDKRDNLNFNELCKTPGTMECAPHFHYNREAGQILNGSNSHPGVLPTALALKAIEIILFHGFHPSLTGKWMREYGVLKKKPAHVSAPVATVQAAPATTETNGTATSSLAGEIPLTALITNQ